MAFPSLLYPRFFISPGYRWSFCLFLTPLLHLSGVQMAMTALLYPASFSLRGTDGLFISSIPRFFISPGYSWPFRLFLTPLLHLSGVQLVFLSLPYPASSSLRGTVGLFISSIPRISISPGYSWPFCIFLTPLSASKLSKITQNGV